MTPALVAMEDVDFSYGRLQVLFGVSLEVHQGEALALLGTNGAGKTTLLRVLAGLGVPSAGRVHFAGEDITGRPAEEIVVAGLALIQGGAANFPDMTVRENLEVQCLPLPDRKASTPERIAAVLETFPALALRQSTLAGSLSGGEQQMLALAKAVLLQPQVVCIDELSLGLAPIVVQELLGMVRRMRESGTTIILVEQSLNIAAELCERAVFLEKGEVRFEGRTAELLERDDIARAVFHGGVR
jgi:ABC-type branched-subunit amino acid transport system ATPase component